MSAPLVVQKVATLKGHTKAVCAAAISPDSSLLATSGSDCVVLLWDVATKQVKAKLNGHTETVCGMVFSPDGSLLATVSYDCSVKLWHIPSGQLKATLKAHSTYVHTVVFSPNGQLLVSGSFDATTIVWDVESGSVKATLRGHSGWVWSVAFSCDGQTIASGSNDNTVKLWSATTFELKKTLRCDGAGCALAFSPVDSNLLASGGAIGDLCLWDAANGTVLRRLKGHTKWVWSLEFSRDGHTLASGSDDKTVKLWDVSSGSLLTTLTEHTGAVRSVALSNDGKLLATTSSDTTIILWDSSVVTAQQAQVAASVAPTQEHVDPNAAKNAVADRVAQLEAELAAAKQDAAAAKQENSKLQQQLAAAKNATDELQQQKEGALRVRDEEIQKLTQQIAAKDLERQQLRDEKSNLQRSHQAALAQNDRTVVQLVEQVASLQQQLAQLQQAADANNASLVMPKEPYRFDAAKLAMLQRVTLDIAVDGQTAPRTLHVDVTPLPPFLSDLWSRGGVSNRPVLGFAIKRFDALAFDSSDMLMQTCKVAAAFLLQGRKTKLEEFNRTYDGAQKTVLDELKKLFVTAPRHSPNVLYTFHGCSAEVASSVLASSLVALHRHDKGFFGQGVYTTPHVEYACRYATNELFGTLAPPTGKPSAGAEAAPPEGCYAVLCCASLVSMAYPVTRDEDYDGPKAPTSKLAGQALKPCCDAHFVPVHQKAKFQACDPDVAQYFELVQNRNELVIPMGVLWVQRV